MSSNLLLSTDRNESLCDASLYTSLLRIADILNLSRSRFCPLGLVGHGCKSDLRCKDTDQIYKKDVCKDAKKDRSEVS